MILVMVFALSRSTFSRSHPKTKNWWFLDDPEIRVGTILIALAVLILTSFSWSKDLGVAGGAEKIWGIFFTSVSFLTTTGLTSTYVPDGLRGFGQAGIIFLALAFFQPKLLKPLNYSWIKLGEVLGTIIAPLIMALVFFIILTPTSFIVRIMGKDLLRLKFSKKNTYWLKRSKNITTMDKQF